MDYADIVYITKFYSSATMLRYHHHHVRSGHLLVSGIGHMEPFSVLRIAVDNSSGIQNDTS